jgi:hypothetical protein
LSYAGICGVLPFPESLCLGVPFHLCILELSRPIHIDMAVKNTTIFL